MKDPRGFSLVSVIIALCVISVSFVGFLIGHKGSTDLSLRARKKMIAQGFASELIDAFRVQNTQHITYFLKRNPVTGSTNSNMLYELCAHTNLLDRQTGRILNEDPIAQLPPSILDGASPTTASNRYYQVHVVRKDTFQISDSYCGQTINAITLLPTERFLVTVGVTWVDPKHPQAQPERLVLSLMVPQ